jgi:hypothetical protein
LETSIFDFEVSGVSGIRSERNQNCELSRYAAFVHTGRIPQPGKQNVSIWETETSATDGVLGSE